MHIHLCLHESSKTQFLPPPQKLGIPHGLNAQERFGVVTFAVTGNVKPGFNVEVVVTQDSCVDSSVHTHLCRQESSISHSLFPLQKFGISHGLNAQVTFGDVTLDAPGDVITGVAVEVADVQDLCVD